MAVKSVIGKVLVEYVALVAVIIGMAAILVYERERIREIETESAEIRQLRRDIRARVSSAGTRQTSSTTMTNACAPTACCKP